MSLDEFERHAKAANTEVAAVLAIAKSVERAAWWVASGTWAIVGLLFVVAVR